MGGQSGCGEEWGNSLLRGRRRPRQPLERDARGSHSVSGAGLQACACGAGREARGVSWTGRWQLQGPVRGAGPGGSAGGAISDPGSVNVYPCAGGQTARMEEEQELDSRYEKGGC